MLKNYIKVAWRNLIRAWICMNKWLQDFDYRIQIEWYIFAITGLLALLIAVLTVSFQALKAALANPVKSLHTE